MRHCLAIFFVVALWICACTSSRVSTRNVSSIYKKESSMIHPRFAVFHTDDYNSELHFGLLSSELLYTRQQNADVFTAHVVISYQLRANYEAKDIIDSGSVKISDVYSQDAKQIIGKTGVKTSPGQVYLLQVTVRDINRNQYSVSYLNIDKSSTGTRQNFLVLSAADGTPLLRNYLTSKERFRLKHRKGNVNLFVRYYKREFPLPPPPFSYYTPKSFEFRADSLFSIELAENDTASFRFAAQGFYHLQIDTGSTDGLTLFRYADHHPLVKTPSNLLEPLRYITSKSEFDKISQPSNLKASVDSFWLACAGNEDRAKELIKKFYGRVQDANQYFSSYTEGWQTDRGLIYLIYGPPNILYKNSTTETWTYGEEHNLNSLTFNFIKVINPFTDDDFRLDRSPVYKDSWYRAVEVWRQGRVYIDN
ncbi:MAG: GWxTD domain-containing protein [Bacteroidota bacterium]